MKIFTLFTVVLLLLLPTQVLSQTNDKLRSDNILPERFIPHSIPDRQIKHLSESDIFQDKESRTVINKTLLDNGFLLVEEIHQYWTGSNWGNDRKYTTLYDVNNNMIEKVEQGWDGQNWGNLKEMDLHLRW